MRIGSLRCSECGSTNFDRTGHNQYTCQHCRAVALVEDDVSQRLDRVLDQVKDAAAERLANEQAARNRKINRTTAISLCVTVGAMVAWTAFSAWYTQRRQGEVAAVSVAARVDRDIPRNGLQLEAPRQVLVGSGSAARSKLLVMARNETGKPLERFSLKAAFHDGNDKLGDRSENLPIGVLLPGERAPVLIDVPEGRNFTRQDLQVPRLAAPFFTVEGPALALSRARLVQQKDAVRLVGRIVNARNDVTLAGCEALVMLYDIDGALIGFGHGYAQATEIKPGERTTIEVHIERFGGRKDAIAAWDYRIDYALLGDDRRRKQVLSDHRVISSTAAVEQFSPGLRLGVDDLLADGGERFDTAQLELLPLAAGRSTTQEPVYLTELVNRSKDRIAVSPGAVVSAFDGSTFDGSTVVDGVAYLYPGERFPVLIEPRVGHRITQTRIEWKPMRATGLPGPRAPLEVEVAQTRAGTSSVLVNFSQRFSYKYVEVRGNVRNPGPAVVRKTKLWVGLRDHEGRLTGFRMVENLPAIGPGEGVPFEVKVNQYGRDFATIATGYQTE